MIDVCHLDEAGFAMTLATSYSWFLIGQRLRVPYQAPEGRRVNAIGARFTHGPAAGHFAYRTWAALPKSRAKQQRKSVQAIAAAHDLTVDDVGAIDSERVLAFIWRVAGRPHDAPANWKRVRPLMIILDNYAVHKSQTIREGQPALVAADVHLVYLPAYCPELSAMEPVWNDVKQHWLPIRSFARVVELKHAVDDALARKARHLRQAYGKSTNLHRLTT
jgi:putative transposase